MWKHDVIPILVHLLRDKVAEVQANVAGALMNATVTTEGEVVCWQGHPPLVQGVTGWGHRSPQQVGYCPSLFFQPQWAYRLGSSPLIPSVPWFWSSCL